MFVIDVFKSRAKANRTRDAFVEAQQVVDVVWARINGEMPEPTANEVYRVQPDGDRWAVVCVDPSAR